MMDLREKVLGCLAASQIGSAMGAPVEGWPWQQTQQRYGLLDRFLPYEHYGNGWQREPGTTEDGIERQRIFLRAIRRAAGRIGPEDVAAVWREEVDPAHADWCMEPFDRRLIRLAKAGAPAMALGLNNPHGDLVSLARSCHPIGLVNACDPETAWRDTLHVGHVLEPPAGTGKVWAAVVAATIAAACRPDATAESAIQCGLALAPKEIRNEIERALEVAAGASEPLAMREDFEAFYSGVGVAYAMSKANEIVSKAMAVVLATGGDPRRAIVTAVNFGRDTDCLAAVAGGIAGTLSGVAALPPQWIEQLDRATSLNPHTCLKLSIAETADIVIRALRNELERARRRVAYLQDLSN